MAMWSIPHQSPTSSERTYATQKPWITGNIRTEQKARAASFKEQDTNPDAYKKSSPQVLTVGNNTSATLIPNTGGPSVVCT